MDVVIRGLKISDLDEVMEIEPVAFGSHHWSHQSFVNELSNAIGHYFAAMEIASNKLVGYSGFWLIGEEAHVTTLAVHPDCRKIYIGERLLVNDLREARAVGANSLTLEVRMSNEVAQQLYFKYGFVSHGVRRNYYQDNDEDALVLWLENIRSPEFITLVTPRIQKLIDLKYLSGQVSDWVSVEPALNGKNGKNLVGNKRTHTPSAHRGADEC